MVGWFFILCIDYCISLSGNPNLVLISFQTTGVEHKNEIGFPYFQQLSDACMGILDLE